MYGILKDQEELLGVGIVFGRVFNFSKIINCKWEMGNGQAILVKIDNWLLDGYSIF